MDLDGLLNEKKKKNSTFQKMNNLFSHRKRLKRRFEPQFESTDDCQRSRKRSFSISEFKVSENNEEKKNVFDNELFYYFFESYIDYFLIK